MSHQPDDDEMRLLTTARPASLDRGSGLSAADLLVKAAAQPPHEQRSPRPSRPRRRPSIVVRLAVAMTAVAIAAVVLVRNADPDGAAPDASGFTPARTVLLAAAERIETQNPATGRYWHTVGQSMAIGQEGRAPRGQEPRMVNYRVTCTHELWTARSRRDPTWLLVTAQSGKPLTKADEETWRSQGAYRLGACEGAGVPGVGGAAPAPPFAVQLDDERHPEVSYPQVGATHVTTAEVMNLPADPAGLRRVLNEWARRGGYADAQGFPFMQATSLLTQLPTTPRVRAALYRVLADLPNVQNIGMIKDPLGRTGTGIQLDGCGGQLIIDEPAGQLLAVQERSPDCTGEVTAWTAVTASGWTDATPVLPPHATMRG
ncbi:CU044_5270 family protein [Nonomuraea sp. NPDC050786]|uniref:CU044_5270 family protein n=1 Tax=Nonomuraea sp. NPDC050786 TaxID=3154840 RepID=UPI0033D4EE0F